MRIFRAIVAALTLLAVAVPTAAAAVHTYPVERAERKAVIFDLSGLTPSTVGSARLKMGNRSVEVATRRVRKGARRGTLRVRIPAAWRTAARGSRRPLRGIRLVVTVSATTAARKKLTAPGQAPAPAPAPAPTPAPAPAPAPSEPIPAGAKFVSPSGSDSAAGTESAPWRTLGKAVASVSAGDTVVFRSGTYGAAGTRTYFAASGTSTAPITLRGYPGEPRPVILGMFRMTGNYQRVTGFVFDGPTGNVGNTSTPTGEDCEIWISGSNNELSYSEVRDSLWHAGIFLSSAENVRIVGNYIHDNGDFNDPGQVNQSHGIYWSSGSGLIANNVIDHNVAFGIHLYKAPHNVTMANNTITRHGRAGILFATDTRDSLAVNNVVTHNQIGIYTYSLAGLGNAAVNNLTWGNTQSNVNVTGVSVTDNLVADPKYVGAGDYRLQAGSPAVDRGAAAFAPGHDILGVARPRGLGPDLGAYESH